MIKDRPGLNSDLLGEGWQLLYIGDFTFSFTDNEGMDGGVRW